ncbi:MAG: acyltransferase family protein [Catenisphaera adipataccumulans]|jgi:peptidoglycan/LPS O-acetylase OafA/YrhL|uniref:acyltransferase family protein n=1 Tax=Catenisphaera adipataccumulans TaxID=700500 RepID=UPI003D94791B
MIYGIAALSIVLFHFTKDVVSYHIGGAWEQFADWYLVWNDAMGVEWFLFLSGMGLFVSMEKNGAVKFEQHRLKRILIPYCLLAIPYWIFHHLIDGPAHWLADTTLVSVFTDHQLQFWYVLFILTMYAFYPLIILLIRNRKHLYLKLWSAAGILSAVFIWLSLHWAPFDRTDVFYCRVLIFVIGCICGVWIYDGKPWQKKDTFLFTAGIALKIWFVSSGVENDALERIVACFYSLSVLGALVLVLEKISLPAFVSWCGAVSLEMYIAHISYRSVFKETIYQPFHFSYPTVYLLVFLCTLLTCFVVQKLYTNVRKIKEIQSTWFVFPGFESQKF